MPRLLLFFLSASLFCLPLSYAQSFTFADTYPTNNVDSLEQWLKTYPKPTEERLKNLIRLERSFRYLYPEKRLKYERDIKALSNQLNHPVGKAFVLLLNSKDYAKLISALKIFEKLRDISGIIYTKCQLVLINYDYTALQTGDQYAVQDYLKQIESLLKTNYNPHDFIESASANFYFKVGKSNFDNRLVRELTEVQKIIESKPELAYASTVFKGCKAMTHYYLGEFEASYRINKTVAQELTNGSTVLRLLYLQSLANDCEFLGRYEERLNLCDQIAQLLRKRPYDYNLYLNLYISYKEELYRKGDYKKAALYGDSIITVQDTLSARERRQRLVEQQASEKQQRIALLTDEKQRAEYRNRLTVGLLLLAVVVMAALGYLGWRLTRANAQLRQLTRARDQLFGLVAHDLRRPLFAFQNLSQLIHFYLRKQDYAAIEEVSANINESGVKLQQMLDNLVAWAISQDEALPYQPTEVLLIKEINEIVELYKTVHVLKKVTFEVAVPPDLVAYADPNGLRVIVRNLIDNSSKALPDGGYLRIAGQPLDDTQVELTFTDDAGGLSPSLLAAVERVFAAPQKAEIGTEGLGMGVVMVARFVQRNGGSISVASEAGKGTTFRVRLPAEKRI